MTILALCESWEEQNLFDIIESYIDLVALDERKRMALVSLKSDNWYGSESSKTLKLKLEDRKSPIPPFDRKSRVDAENHH